MCEFGFIVLGGVLSDIAQWLRDYDSWGESVSTCVVVASRGSCVCVFVCVKEAGQLETEIGREARYT